VIYEGRDFVIASEDSSTFYEESGTIFLEISSACEWEISTENILET